MTASAHKKILFVTGTRADFGKLKPLIEKVEESPDLEAHIFATGMHMLGIFGYTFHEIEKCGFANVFPHFNQTAGAKEEMDFSLANTVLGLGHYIRELEPDLIIVHGDRVEALAGAIAGSLNDVRVGHIEGGEVSGTIDESIRHAVSKLSHLHFVANDEARSRLIQLGEAPESVFVIGSPEIDVMLSGELPHLEEVRDHYEISFDEYAIFIYHSVTTEIDSLKQRVQEVVAAALESGDNYIALYPNNDKGSGEILDELKALEKLPNFRVIPSLRFESFLTLLKNAQYILGNSSAGVREAPVYGVTAINVGSRQNGRFQGSSIVHVPEDRASIVAAIKNRPDENDPSFHFGEGESAAKFIDELHQARLWNLPKQKVFCDMSTAGKGEE